MIISASRRTDIPAFYSEWFMDRIADGYFVNINPFNPRQKKEISLLPEDVDVFVFWSKNPASLLPYLQILDDKGYRYYFQFTLNDYSAPALARYFEPNIPPLASRIDIFKKLSSLVGAEKVIWRYDPIIISNVTPVEYHLENFYRLTEELKGYTHRVIISFLDLYPKLNPWVNRLYKEQHLEIIDVTGKEQVEKLDLLARSLGNIAVNNNLAIYSCAEKADLDKYHIRHGGCIDVTLINQIFNLNMNVKKDKSQRPECLCAASVDMGTYNTCKFSCNYCYANKKSVKFKV